VITEVTGKSCASQAITLADANALSLRAIKNYSGADKN